jgi:hypothetical protein
MVSRPKGVAAAMTEHAVSPAGKRPGGSRILSVFIKVGPTYRLYPMQKTLAVSGSAGVCWLW